MSRYRIVQIRCPEASDGCFLVEKYWMFGIWRPFLTTYDRGGCAIPRHFQTRDAAKRAFDREMASRRVPDGVVVQEWTE